MLMKSEVIGLGDGKRKCAWPQWGAGFVFHWHGYKCCWIRRVVFIINLNTFWFGPVPHHRRDIPQNTMTKPLVLLTGPTGFVGAHVFRALLTNGYRVRGTIRHESGADFLRQQYPSHTSDMEFVIVPDIQAAGALDSATKDVDYICHVASPYFTSTDDPIKELVEPAVNG